MSENQNYENKYYTVSEAAKVLELTEYTVRKKIREGVINAIHGSSDREGYRISHDELIRYAKNNGRSEIINNLGVGLTVGVPLMVGVGFSKVMDNLKGRKKKNVDYEKIQKLSIESIQDEIDAIQYWIQALELDGENLSIDDKKRILDAKARIKLLEKQIKEIKIKSELS